MDEQYFYDYYKLANIRSEQELNKSLSKKLVLLFPSGIVLVLAGYVLIRCLPAYFQVGCILGFLGVVLIFLGIVFIEYDGTRASREDIMELMERVRRFKQIEILFCSYMEKRGYLTKHEYDLFDLTIQREEEKQNEIKFKQTVQSMCQNNTKKTEKLGMTRYQKSD